MTRSPCICRSVFGAGAHQEHVPTSESLWRSNRQFEKIWNATLLKHCERFENQDRRPIWLTKWWQVLWNWNAHNQNHSIALHQDYCSTYSGDDPITSFSFGHGGVLTLGLQIGNKEPTKMLFQQESDALIMAGEFQKESYLSVPERPTWKALKSCCRSEACAYNLQYSLARHALEGMSEVWQEVVTCSWDTIGFA